MVKPRHDTAFFQRSYSSGSSHGMTPSALKHSIHATKPRFHGNDIN
ncbi:MULTISPECIES: hypothetical protein [unclassified Rickettsia]